MKTITLKIMNHIDISDELRVYNSILRFAFNRYQDSMKEKEIRALIKMKFKDAYNSWFVQCAIKNAESLFKKFKNKNIIFGGKKNLLDFLRHRITKEEYKIKRNSPLLIQGEKLHKGNRLFNFDFENETCVFKINKTTHHTIKLPCMRKNIKREFAQLQELCNQKEIAITISLSNSKISFTFDETLLKHKKFKQLKSNRVIGLDLNPNYIGISVLSFDKTDNMKILHKEVIETKELNKTSGECSSHKSSVRLTNKRRHEIIHIAHKISNMMNIWKCSKLCIEELNFKTDDTGKDKHFNRLCKNVWDRTLFTTKLKMLSNIYGFEYVEVNPAYSSIIGNVLYKNEHAPDMVLSSIEIGRRGYKKFHTGWFYPIFDEERIDELWKQTLSGVKHWKEACQKIKNSGLKYRIQLKEIDAVFSKFYIKSKIKLYNFV